MLRYRRYVLVPLLVSALLVPAGYALVQWSKGGTGAGLYSREWQPESVHGYWDPDKFYQPVQSVAGVYEGEQCVECHAGVTPGVVNDWRASGHARADGAGAPVYCNACHGNDHQNLHLPSPEVCANCHRQQVQEFHDERRYGFPSHVLAMERAVDAKHFVDKPKAEVASCVQCHSVATKCDSCHTRHRFSAAEARRPEACITCHSGPPHPDDATYFASAHGQRYLAQGADWDWSRPLKQGNYAAPTCAYCHMHQGKHQVADKAIWKFGLREVNPLNSGNEVRRRAWLGVCDDCHEADWAQAKLRGLDKERKRAWGKLYAAEDILKDLRTDDVLHPNAGERPPYPTDLLDRLWPRARVGFFEGQASAFYNVSPIERDYFEMWYFANLGAYKGAAHGSESHVAAGHEAMDRALSGMSEEAQTLRDLAQKEHGAFGARAVPGRMWVEGEYTNLNRERN